MPKNKVKKPSEKIPKKVSWLQRSLLFIVKILIATFFTLAVFAIYLDAKIRDTFEGQRWNVPVQVYGQLQLLTLGDYENIGEIAQSLVLKGYKKVRHVTAEGQFSQSTNRLIIFQKPFDSPDGLHNAKQLTITIVNGRVFRLKVNGKKVKSLTLAPQLLARLVPNNKEDMSSLLLGTNLASNCGANVNDLTFLPLTFKRKTRPLTIVIVNCFALCRPSGESNGF